MSKSKKEIHGSVELDFGERRQALGAEKVEETPVPTVITAKLRRVASVTIYEYSPLIVFLLEDDDTVYRYSPEFYRDLWFPALSNAGDLVTVKLLDGKVVEFRNHSLPDGIRLGF